MIWILPLLLAALTVLWGFLSSNLIMNIPREVISNNPGTFGVAYDPFQLSSFDGVLLDGWFVPCKKKSNSVLFMLHGWGACRSDILPSSIFLADHYNLVYFDFRNHGVSGAAKTSLTCSEIKDFITIVNYTKQARPEFCGQMAVFGFSMGSSVAIVGSTQMPEIKAVIAESPFASFNETVARFANYLYGIPRFLVPITLMVVRFRLGFDPEACAPLYHVAKLSPRPLLIIQGGSDARMPPTEGQGLFETAKEPKEIWVVPGADHGEVHQKGGEEYQKRILAFYQKWLTN